MEERKHIDRLYQEKFKDFEATPREAVWNNISSRLQEKQRNRKVLPLWYRIAGVAAVLALLINYANGLFRITGVTAPSTVSAENNQPRNFGELRLVSNSYTENMTRSSIILQAIIEDTRSAQEKENLQASNPNTPAAETGRTILAQNPTEKIILNPLITSFELESAFAIQNLKPAPEIVIPDEGKKLPLPVPSETESISEEELSTTSLSSNSRKMRISTIAAPVYFDNMGKGNAIDSRFANNASSGEVSMAYGINFAYQISEKIKIRSGISKVDLSHNTENIAFTATVNPSALSGIDYKGDIPKYRIENTISRPFSNVNASTEFNRSSLAAPVTGFLNQRIGFIEVPLELEYVIIDKKIGLNIIGGGSTLFLDENMISLNSANFSTRLGEANNLNSLSFSTNIGIGVDYKITPQFQLNLEPIFKYQINTFQSNADLTPYYFGVYSGFSFKF